MANQISKEELVDYLKHEVKRHGTDVNSYTTKGKYYHASEAAYSTYWSLLTLIQLGRFDENKR